MKYRKLLLLFIIFLSMLGAGSMLSNVQSREANQLLEAYGLSNNTRYIEVKNEQKVSSFLKYLQKNFPKNKVQVHLSRKSKDNQTLIWSNHDVLKLPTESGRYFTKDDFRGRVSFAVLGLNAQIKTFKTQGNQYVFLNGKYYTVIGTLKHYRQMKQNGYYLSTGPEQPTGKFMLKNYVIIIDSSNKVIRRIAAHYGVKVKTPHFVKNHQIYQFSIIKEIILILFFIIVAAVTNFILAYIDEKTVQQTNLTGELLRNWLINHGIRTILIEILLAVGAYFFLCWRAFFSKSWHLVWLFIIFWVVIASAYIYSIFHLSRKDKINA